MTRRLSLTLGQVFLLSLLGLTLLLGLLFYFLLDGSQRSILESSSRLRREVGKRLMSQVVAFRDQATEVADDVERELQNGLIRIDDLNGLESAFHAQVLNHPDIAEVSLTHADALGDDGFSLRLAPRDRWEVSVYRAADEANRIVARQVKQRGNSFIAEIGDPGPPPRLATQPTAFAPGEGDPTTQPTFSTLTMRANRDHPVWTDLYYSELPAEAGSGERVEVTVQKDVFDHGKFLGVVRVGLLETQLNQVIDRSTQSAPDSGDVPHTCFLCDAQGRLITPVTPADQLKLDNDDLRISSPDMPPRIRAALDSPALHSIQDTPKDDRLLVGDQYYLATYLPLEQTQDWVLAVVGSEDDYLGNLIQTRHQLLAAALLVMGTILLCGALTLRSVQRGLSRVIGATGRMRQFDFAPTPTDAPFRDVRVVMESLEQAKTAMRAMGKYVPMDLVRDLYEMNREPALGGELRELSIMFTDIEGFTSVAEAIPPDRLALALGQYLQVMTAAIHDQGGTVDKFIGDGVMALWNAPRPCADHAAKASAAALACVAATRRLFASDDWKGLPPLRTRCGLNRDRVMVGHFGAPDRISYTALGDGVNLASRLEGLNKQYGTSIIVSQAIRDEAGNAFSFRLLDRVAVSGKTQAVQVHELLESPQAWVRQYENALEFYWRRDFAAAAAILERQPSDPPSVAMARRCRQLISQPPPADWDGVFSAMK
jgi:adenylate cyclase